MHALEKIPESRRAAVFAAHALSREAFEVWAGINSGELPDEPIDAMQVRLARWQIDRFGGTGGDVLMALGIVEELGETADAADEGHTDVNGGAEQAVDGLGDTMVYASQLCTSNRLAIRPILDLAKLYTKHESATAKVIMAAAGKLSHVVLKHEQKIRGLGDPVTYRVRLVDALALCIAKAIDECEMGHNLTVSAPGVFTTVGTEILERKQGDAMIPIAPEITVRVQHVVMSDPDRAVEFLMAQMHDGIDALAKAEKLEGPGDFDVSDAITDNLCPQCAGLLSDSGDSGVLICENGHDITGEQMAAFRAASPK